MVAKTGLIKFAHWIGVLSISRASKQGEITMQPLSEIEQRILAELDEFKFEDLPTFLNTFFFPKDPANNVKVYQDAVRRLFALGLIYISITKADGEKFVRADADQAIREIDQIPFNIKYDAVRGSWFDARRTGPPFGPSPSYIVVTDKGLLEGQKILTARGYRWWEPKK